MHIEKRGTWQHGVSACKGVDFLGNQQLPPEHGGCCRKVPPRKSEGACCRTACTFDVVASEIDALYCDVLVAL